MTEQNHKDNTACPDCDLLLATTSLRAGQKAVCPRCGKNLQKRIASSAEKTLALSLSGLIIFLPAILLPLISFESFGFSDSANVLESIAYFFTNRYYFVAILVLLSAVIFPLTLLCCIFLVSLHIRRGKGHSTFIARMFRTWIHLEEWAMVEVYLLGIMITIIKMADSADVSFHLGILCFVALVITNLAIHSVIDRCFFWSHLESDESAAIQPQTPHTTEPLTALGTGLLACHLCHKLMPGDMQGQPCPRCGESVHSRKPGSTNRTWALVLTAAILIFPANILPIMQVDYLGIPDRSTILDGIIYFFKDGSWGIGLIIFVASILVPVFKIVGLAILLLTTRPCGPHLLNKKARMYRFIAFIGRWSMLDIFVIALLTGLVDFGFFTSIQAAPAATYFCIVVAATMWAAIVYDPRIMWDRCFVCNKDHNQPIQKT